MKIAKNRKLVQRARASSKRGRDVATRAKRHKIADSVRRYIEAEGITRPELEKRVKRGQTTMDHFFAGDFADSLLERVESALGKQFGESSRVAPTEWGGYSQEGTAKFAGNYLTLRNDFKNPIQICAYVTAIEWGKIEQAHIFDGRLIQEPKINGYGLVFREEGRADSKYAHRGQVWIPSGQYLYLITAYGDGRLRAAIASLPDLDGKMTGIQLSLYNPKGTAFAPAAAPIAFIKQGRLAPDDLGNIEPGHPKYDDYRDVLSAASEDVVIALTP
jgi:hypothetical protein